MAPIVVLVRHVSVKSIFLSVHIFFEAPDLIEQVRVLAATQWRLVDLLRDRVRLRLPERLSWSLKLVGRLVYGLLVHLLRCGWVACRRTSIGLYSGRLDLARTGPIQWVSS